MSWRVCPALAVLANQVDARFPTRSKLSDGTIGDAAHRSRKSDHNPDPDESVNARDWTDDPSVGFSVKQFAAELIAADDARLRYMILGQKIWLRGVGWTRYGGAFHRHLHTSIYHDERENDTRAWKIPMLGAPVDPSPLHFPTSPQEDDDMPGFLVSDGQQVWLTDGLTKRAVPFDGQRFNELYVLGQIRNPRTEDGGFKVEVMAQYLESIPLAG